MVSGLAFYSYDPSSNPAEKGAVGPFLKNILNLQMVKVYTTKFLSQLKDCNDGDLLAGVSALCKPITANREEVGIIKNELLLN